MKQHDPAPTRAIYVVASPTGYRRLRSLVELTTEASELLYVSSEPIGIDPALNLVAPPYLNPLGLLARLGLHRLKVLLDSLAYFPTRDMVHVVPIQKKLRRLIHRDLAAGKDVVVLTSAPPHPFAIVGLQLKRAFPSIRWVIDWQDLWSYDALYFNRIHPWYRNRARRLELELIRECDINVTTNRFAKQALEALGALEPARVVAINHHFDAEQRVSHAGGVRAQSAARDSNAPRIVYMGGMFKAPKVPGGRFLEALRSVRAESRVQPTLHLFGPQSDEFDAYRERLGEYGAVWRGVIEPDRVIHELRQYDYQLLLLDDLPNSRLIMHQKIPEYLLAGPRILAIVPRDSAVADIIQRTGTGYVIPADSDWQQGIRDVVERASGVPIPVRNEAEIQRFSWDFVRSQWADVLDLPPEALPQQAYGAN